MNGITHKQAIQFIHRQLDGMLKGDQALLLDQHLDSCDICRAYASEMDALPAQLNAELKSRWDADQGPSENVAKNVSTQARKIPTQQRFASAVKLVTGLAAIVVLAFFMNFMVSRLQSASVTADGTPFVPSEEPSGLLAFTSNQDGNAEIYTMHADGTGMVNLTNDPANDSFPFWSPDGRQIAFESDRDGSAQIYLMNADGSNVTQLTEGEGDHHLDANGYSPWSPDGSKLIVVHMLPGAQTLQPYVLNIADKSITPLTDQPGGYILLSWSADGTHVAFVSTEQGRFAADLYVVRSDGNNLIKLTEDLQAGEYFSRDYEWSAEGESIFFATHRNEQIYQDAMYFSTIYRSSVDGVREIAAQVTDRQIIDWWDGGEIRLELAERMMRWTRSDGSESHLELCEKSNDINGIAFERSRAGNLVFGFDCIPDGWMLYWITPDATTATPLLSAIIPYQQDSVFGLTFSFDERHIAFVTLDSTSVDLTETLYIVDVAKAREDPSAQPLKLENSFGQDWQPISKREVVEEEPTPGPTQTTESEDTLPIGTNISNGEWIAFIGGRSIPDPANSMYVTTEQDVFLIHPDGSGLVNITNSPDMYMWPQWSPNGNDLLFLRIRNSGGMDILRKNEFNGSDVLVSTSMSFDRSFNYSWSPNSEQIAFVDTRSGNLDIYTMYADGRDDPQITRLTDDPAQDFGSVWSPDGDSIAFQRLDGDTLSIHVMNKDGSNPHEVAQGKGRIQLYWSHDGKVLYASSGSQLTAQSNWLACEGCSRNPAIYRMDPSGSSVEQIYAEPEYSQVGFHLYDTPQNTLYFMRVEPQPFVEFWGRWFRFDGTSVQQIDPLDPHQTCKTTDGNILSEDISPNQRFSIVTNFCAGGFDLYLVDREASHPKLRHLIQLPLDILGLGGNFAYLPITWSPDGRQIIYDNGYGSMFLLDLEKIMQNSNTQPVPLIQPALYEGQSGQMFQSPDSIFVIDLVWQPISNRKVVEEKPTPEPTQVPVVDKLPDIGTNIPNGEWIAFIAGANAPEANAYDPASVLTHQNVFVIHPDGSSLTNVTNSYARYSDLRWSPNGQHLLFVRENADLNKIDIMRHSPDSAESSALTKPILDPDHYGYSWSPNSDKIAFADSSNGNYDIYTIYADGRSDLQWTQLTHDPAQDVGFVWSPDGSQIAFQSLTGDELSIYIMSEDGSNQHEVAHGMGKVTLYWSHDGRAIYASGMEGNWLECEGCAHKPGIYRIDLDNSSVQQVYAEELNTQQFFWNLYEAPLNVLYFLRINPPTFVEYWGTWFRADGNSVQQIGELNPQQTCKTTTGNVLNEHISPNKRFSVISNYCAGGFDLYLADREMTEPKLTHLLRLPLDTWGQGGDSATLPMGWSPDGRWLLYISDTWQMYLLNLEDAMRDPNTKPILLIQPEQPIILPGQGGTFSGLLQIFDLSWQPKP